MRGPFFIVVNGFVGALRYNGYMSRIPDEDIQRVRDATDIVELISQSVVLKQKGGVFWGCCPFHGEKTPSFKVDPSFGTYYCFGCHKHGNAFDYLMETDSLTFREAVISLAERAHVEIHLDENNNKSQGSSQRLRELCEETASFYQAFLTGSPSTEASQARAYMSKRNLNIEVAKRWRLGFAPGHKLLVEHLKSKSFNQDEMVKANVALVGSRGLSDRFFNRIMFPIADVNGRIIAFGGRVIGKGEPKYLNSSDTPLFHKSRNLFGLDKAKETIVKSKTAIVVEGYTDVIALHESGFTNAVATLGTALTAQHIKLLSRFAQRIIYIFDGDEAGMRAASRAVEFIDDTIAIETNSNPMVLDVVVLPDGRDPAEVTGQDNGKELFAQCLKKAVPLIQFSIDRKLAQWDLSRSEERQRAINDATSILVPLKGTVMASDYAQYIVDKLWAHGVRVDVSAVMSALENNKAYRSPYRGGEDTIESEAASEKRENMFTPAAQATADERLAQEALVYMIRDKDARAYFAENVRKDEFCFEIYQTLFEQITGNYNTHDAPVLLSMLAKEYPGLDAIITSHVDIGTDREIIAEATKEIAQRLKERALERTVAVLTDKMKDASLNAEQRQELVINITAAQKDLLNIRAQRH